MSAALTVEFMRAVILITGFKGSEMKACQAAMLMMALNTETFTAAQVPAELTNGSTHLAGAATGALISLGLIEVCGRVKSPLASAKGRRVNLLRLAPLKRSTVLTWLKANDLPIPEAGQQMALIA